MTKEEIKALVAAKIAGQGSAIDSASVLPTILNAIVDAIPEDKDDPEIALFLNKADFNYSEKIEISKDLYEKASVASLLVWEIDGFLPRTLSNAGVFGSSIFDKSDNNLPFVLEDYITSLFDGAFEITTFGHCSQTDGTFDFEEGGEICAFFKDSGKYYFFGTEM